MQRAISQPEGVLPAALTLFVGVGERGGRVVAGLGNAPPFGPDDADPKRHLGRMTLLSSEIVHEPDGEILPAVSNVGRLLAGQIVGRLERMLTHSSVDSAREREATHQTSSLATKVLVVIFADVGEQSVRAALLPMLRELDALAGERLRPVFPAHRRGSNRNLVVLPVLTTPHVHGSPVRGEIAACIHAVYTDIAEQDGGVQLASTMYVLEDVTDLSVLESADVDALLENFALCITEALGSALENAEHNRALRFGEATLERVVRGRQPRNPLGTFAVARAEPCADRVREYARCSMALRVLGAVTSVAVEAQGAEGRQEIESNLREAFSLEPESQIRAEVKKSISDAAPAALAVPGWNKFKREVDQSYGPACGDYTDDLDRTRSPESQWLCGVQDRLQRALERIDDRFEGLIESYRVTIAHWEHGRDGSTGVSTRLRQELDAVLSAQGRSALAVDEGSYARARQHAAMTATESRVHVREAVVKRDSVPLEDAPDFAPVEFAHTELLASVRAIPALGVLVLVGITIAVGFAALLAPALHALATILSDRPDGAMMWLLHKHPYVTATLCSSALTGGVMTFVFMQRYQHARTRLDDLEKAVERLFHGERGSLSSFFTNRLDYAWQVARTGAMTRAAESAERDLKRLQDVERALAGAVERYRKRVSLTGVVAHDDGLDDASGLFADLRRPLVAPLLEHEVVARIVHDASLVPANVLARAEQNGGLYSRWRDELPFLDDSLLDEALTPDVRALIPDPLTSRAELAASLASKLSAFAATQRRSLPLGLAFGGRESDDRSDGIDVVAEGLLVPDKLLRGAGIVDSLKGIEVGVTGGASPTGRIYALRIQNGIDAAAVEWLAPLEAS